MATTKEEFQLKQLKSFLIGKKVKIADYITSVNYIAILRMNHKTTFIADTDAGFVCNVELLGYYNKAIAEFLSGIL